MRATSGHIFDVIHGGDFTGPERKPMGRITVDADWNLNLGYGPIGSYPAKKLPVRWLSSTSNPAWINEVEVPNVKTIKCEWSIDQDAATCDIVIYNTDMSTLSVGGLVGDPGHLTSDRGKTTNRWGHTTNSWEDIITEGCLLRSYEGYGGYNADGTKKSIAACLDGGYIVQTGTWIIDTVRITTDGLLSLKGRDLMALLIDQPCLPPLVPSTFYPVEFSRYAIRHVDTPRVDYGSHVSGAKLIVGGAACPEVTDATGQVNTGYWVCGDDGGVFTFGSGIFHGADIGVSLHSIVGMTASSGADGYWVGRANGHVFTFGGAPNLGSAVVEPIGGRFSNYVDIASPRDTDGVIMVSSLGEVGRQAIANFGSTPTTPADITGIAVMHDAGGYWMVNKRGQVYAYGAAPYAGNTPDDTGHDAVDIITSHGGAGYYVVEDHGAVYAFGDATYYGGADLLTLTDPISSMILTPDGFGYWLVAEDGGVFSYGSAVFYGSLVAESHLTLATDGNYLDFSDILKSFLLWAGFWLHPEVDGDGNPLVWGSIESTGSFAVDIIPHDLFDKQQIIDCLTKIKEIVGFILLARFDGSIQFSCVDAATEALTPAGWRRHDELVPGDRVLTLDRESGESYWELVDTVNRYEVHDEEMVRLRSRSHDSLTTPNHRWWTQSAHSRRGRWRRSDALISEDAIPIAAPYRDAPKEAAYDDAFVELVGWWISEGHQSSNSSSYICQSHVVNEPKCDRIQKCFEKVYGPEGRANGYGWARKQYKSRPNDYCWTFGNEVLDDLLEVAPLRILRTEFLLKLTKSQLLLLIDAAMAGDGHRQFVGSYGPYDRYTQKDLEAVRPLEMACVLAGVAPRTTRKERTESYYPRTGKRYKAGAAHRMSVLRTKRIKPVTASSNKGGSATVSRERYTGTVWCPTLRHNGVWMARRHGTVFFTGNSPNWWGPGNFLPDGTHTDVIPTIDENYDLLSYGVQKSRLADRSNIIISTDDPNDTQTNTITTNYTLPGLSRGLVRPTMLVNSLYSSSLDQEIMAELIAMHIIFQRRLGSATHIGNPLLEVDDQVQLFEQQTEEQAVHYIRGISTDMDLDEGSYTQTTTTHVLGMADDWVIVMPDGFDPTP